MKTIVSGVDGSPGARAALRAAASITKDRTPSQPADKGPPIVGAIDTSAASGAAIAEAVRLGVELDAPIVFVYVRRGPAGFFGEPVYQRRLTKEMRRARRVLERALAVAAGSGLNADAEILEGSPRRRIAQFARDRDARLIVVGSRRRRLGPSVSSGVVRAAGRPVVVAKGRQRLAVAGEAV